MSSEEEQFGKIKLGKEETFLLCQKMTLFITEQSAISFLLIAVCFLQPKVISVGERAEDI
jgi:hypothetical protein